MKKLISLLFILLPLVIFSFGGNCGGNGDSGGDEILISSRLSNPVTLDGKITSSEEWADTDAYEVSLDKAWGWPDKQVEENAAEMTVRFKNDDVWLYMLYKIAWSASDIDSNDGGAIALFTGPYGPPWAESDYSYLSFGEGTWDAYGWDDSQWYTDTDAGGQNDVEGAASHDGTYYWFEFRKKLNSGDGYDWALTPPQIVGDGDSNLLVSAYDDSLVIVYEQEVLLQLSE